MGPVEMAAAEYSALHARLAANKTQIVVAEN
jgi:hypothetical protein